MPDITPLVTVGHLRERYSVPADDHEDDQEMRGVCEQASSWAQVAAEAIGGPIEPGSWLWRAASQAALSYALSLWAERQNWPEKARINYERALKEMESIERRIQADRPKKSSLVIGERGLDRPMFLMGTSGYVTRSL